MDLFFKLTKNVRTEKKENKLPGSGYAFVNPFSFKLFLSYIIQNEITQFSRNPNDAYKCFLKICKIQLNHKFEINIQGGYILVLFNIAWVFSKEYTFIIDSLIAVLLLNNLALEHLME